QRAYALFQYLSISLVFLAGLGVKVLSGGRIWWSVASLVILMYPGCRTGMDLAQNPMMSLAILVWGWVLASRGGQPHAAETATAETANAAEAGTVAEARSVGRGYEWAGGAVWGLFVFKPT